MLRRRSRSFPAIFGVSKAARGHYNNPVHKPAHAGSDPESPSGLRLWLYFTSAVCGAAIMVIEILGAKLLSPFVGTSHFVWTAQIGVTLIALATGYYAGGWIAQRSPRLTWLYAGMLAAAVYLGSGVLWHSEAALWCLKFRLAIGSLLAALFLFFLPLALLAMAGPLLVRHFTHSLEEVGGAVGRLSAVSTLGSVLGTVLIGYVLIPHCRNSVTLFGTATFLAVVGLAHFLLWERKRLPPAGAALLLAVVLGGLGALRPPDFDRETYVQREFQNSNFGVMQVLDAQGGSRRYYLNDLLVQNTWDIAEQRSGSLFTYMLEGLARAYAPEMRHALCIGLGVGAVPMSLARGGVRVEAVEINPAVVPLAERHFGFDRGLLNLTIGDGRQFLNTSTNLYDAIVLDAFLGESPPAHLMTREAFAAMQRRLRPDGVLVMNTFGDFLPGRDFFPASLDQTLRSVFRSVRCHAAGNGNVFFVATDQASLRAWHPPDFAAVPDYLRSIAEYAWEHTTELDNTHGRVLTDDFNPVDFHDAVNREDLRRRLALSNFGR
jgi:predicted membrane-bound spermidine synthase